MQFEFQKELERKCRKVKSTDIQLKKFFFKKVKKVYDLDSEKLNQDSDD